PECSPTFIPPVRSHRYGHRWPIACFQVLRSGAPWIHLWASTHAVSCRRSHLKPLNRGSKNGRSRKTVTAQMDTPERLFSSTTHSSISTIRTSERPQRSCWNPQDMKSASPNGNAAEDL